MASPAPALATPATAPIPSPKGNAASATILPDGFSGSGSSPHDLMA